MFVKLADLDIVTWKAITDLYKQDSLPPHCYTIYDMLYYLESIDFQARIRGDAIQSYVLVWKRDPDYCSLHLWNTDFELFSMMEIPQQAKVVLVQLYNEKPGNAEEVADHLRSRGYKRVEKTLFHDMVCDSISFKPYSGETLAVKLGSEHIELLLDLKASAGEKVSIERIVELLRDSLSYGVVVNSMLVSTAFAYLRLPEIYIIGDVFTRPEYRRKGYAKAVVSAVTRRAIETGAIAVLHVNALNEPAIRVYKSLGYSVIRTRSWIIASS